MYECTTVVRSTTGTWHDIHRVYPIHHTCMSCEASCMYYRHVCVHMSCTYMWYPCTWHVHTRTTWWLSEQNIFYFFMTYKKITFEFWIIFCKKIFIYLYYPVSTTCILFYTSYIFKQYTIHIFFMFIILYCCIRRYCCYYPGTNKLKNISLNLLIWLLFYF